MATNSASEGIEEGTGDNLIILIGNIISWVFCWTFERHVDSHNLILFHQFNWFESWYLKIVCKLFPISHDFRKSYSKQLTISAVCLSNFPNISGRSNEEEVISISSREDRVCSSIFWITSSMWTSVVSAKWCSSHQYTHTLNKLRMQTILQTRFVPSLFF